MSLSVLWVETIHLYLMRGFVLFFICPLSFWLTLPRGLGESCPRLVMALSIHPGRAWPSSPACTWHFFLALSFSPGNSLVFSWCDHIVCYSFLALTVCNSSFFTQSSFAEGCGLMRMTTRVSTLVCRWTGKLQQQSCIQLNLLTTANNTIQDVVNSAFWPCLHVGVKLLKFCSTRLQCRI